MGKKYILPINTDNLDKILITKSEELDNKITEFSEKYVTLKTDRFDNVEKTFNPLAVATYFFSSINPMQNVEPIYTSEQLSKVWDLYEKIVAKVNLEIGTFNPTLSHFAKFAGITLEKMQELKMSPEESMSTLINKIYNEIFDSNVLLAQNKKLVAKPTEYRMKFENEALERRNPNVNVNIKTTEVNLEQINARVQEIKKITSGKVDYEE